MRLVEEVKLEYDFCDLMLGKVRHLKSEEKEQMYLWLGKQLDIILTGQPHAIINSQDLTYKILDKGVFEGNWENISEAKKFTSKLLSYVRRYEQVPIVVVRVNVPEDKFPPEIQIARMKSHQIYSDEEIRKKAKALGLEENKAREIIKDHINIAAKFDYTAFCRKLKEGEKAV